MNSGGSFSIKEALKAAWENFSSNVVKCLLLSTTYFLLLIPSRMAFDTWLKVSENVVITPQNMQEYFSNSVVPKLPLLGFASLYTIFLSILATYFFVTAAMTFRSRHHTLGILPRLSLSNFFRFFLARGIFLLKVLLGLCLLVIPGIYLYLKNIFAGFSIIQHPTTTRSQDTAITHSLTYGVKMKLLLLLILQVIAQSAVEGLVQGSIPLGFVASFVNALIFLFFTLAFVDSYFQLQASKGLKQADLSYPV